jgi:DNA polymerase V
MRPSCYALVDCNNFYVSCERVFNPKLRGRPVVVLSNNDGCIVSRSQEAKDLGVQMAGAAYKHEALFQEHGVEVFSSNYTLYGDMSWRVMDTLSRFAADIEIYSIDEAFLPLDRSQRDLAEYGRTIRATVDQWTGIPVSIGIAPTKTLAKLASDASKKDPAHNGVMDLSTASDIDALLGKMNVGKVWGIGRERSAFLRRYGIETALDLKNAPDRWIKKHLSVMGLRTAMELRGIPCIHLDDAPAPKKAIASTRSFGKAVFDLKDLEEAVAVYADRAAEKLRSQGSAAGVIQVFIRTNPYNGTLYYADARSVHIENPTSYTPELVKHAHKGLREIYRKGYAYAKAGVVLCNLISESTRQLDLFESYEGLEKRRALMKTIDAINKKLGSNTIRPASTGAEHPWKMKQEKRSNCYTTRWKDLLTIEG